MTYRFYTGDRFYWTYNNVQFWIIDIDLNFNDVLVEYTEGYRSTFSFEGLISYIENKEIIKVTNFNEELDYL